MLTVVDWLVIGAYLLFALYVGLAARERAGQSRTSYFIADRSLPWWWAGVVTDAGFIALRHDGPASGYLRSFRAVLYSLVYNVIILGWVLRAMGKIVQTLGGDERSGRRGSSAPRQPSYRGSRHRAVPLRPSR